MVCQRGPWPASLQISSHSNHGRLQSFKNVCSVSLFGLGGRYMGITMFSESFFISAISQIKNKVAEEFHDEKIFTK